MHRWSGHGNEEHKSALHACPSPPQSLFCLRQEELCSWAAWPRQSSRSQSCSPCARGAQQSRASTASPPGAGGHGGTLRSLLGTRKQEACLCSSETAEEGAQCFTECAEVRLVRGSVGGALCGFGQTLGEGLSFLALSEREWLSASLRHSLWSSFMFDRWTLYEIRKQSLWSCSAQAPCLSHSVMSVYFTALCFWWDHVRAPFCCYL